MNDKLKELYAAYGEAVIQRKLIESRIVHIENAIQQELNMNSIKGKQERPEPQDPPSPDFASP